MTHCWPGAFENSKGLLIDFMKGEGLVITCNHHCRIVSLQGLVKRFFFLGVSMAARIEGLFHIRRKLFWLRKCLSLWCKLIQHSDFVKHSNMLQTNKHMHDIHLFRLWWVCCRVLGLVFDHARPVSMASWSISARACGACERISGIPGRIRSSNWKQTYHFPSLPHNDGSNMFKRKAT